MLVAGQRVADQDRGIGRVAVGFVGDLDRRQAPAAVEPERPGQHRLAIEAEARVGHLPRRQPEPLRGTVARRGESAFCSAKSCRPHQIRRAGARAAMIACAASRPVCAPPFM